MSVHFKQCFSYIGTQSVIVKAVFIEKPLRFGKDGLLSARFDPATLWQVVFIGITERQGYGIEGDQPELKLRFMSTSGIKIQCTLFFSSSIFFFFFFLFRIGYLTLFQLITEEIHIEINTLFVVNVAVVVVISCNSYWSKPGCNYTGPFNKAKNWKRILWNI